MRHNANKTSNTIIYAWGQSTTDMMETNLGYAVLYTAVFLIYSSMEVLGIMPQELRSAGITLPSLLSRWFGDQSMDFSGYHIRRTTATTLLHVCLPLAYCVGLGLVAPELDMLDPWHCPLSLCLLWMVASASLFAGVGVALYWSHDQWKRHPLVVKLSQFGQQWRTVASSVNREFGDIDKFISVLGGSTVIVTDSWILQCNVHTVDLIHQRDAVLNVSATEEHRLSIEGQSAQYLTINVDSINSKFKSFTIRLNSLQYSQLKDKLQAPIRTARNLMVHQSLGDRFQAAFTEQVERNGVYQLPSGSSPLEPCIGCMLKLPEVKLQKRCADLEEGSCRQCYCRPLWCLSCMSKWFAARQDQHRPDSWMGSMAPCPMCRAQFCMLDILRVDASGSGAGSP